MWLSVWPSLSSRISGAPAARAPWATRRGGRRHPGGWPPRRGGGAAPCPLVASPRPPCGLTPTATAQPPPGRGPLGGIGEATNPTEDARFLRGRGNYLDDITL